MALKYFYWLAFVVCRPSRGTRNMAAIRTATIWVSIEAAFDKIHSWNHDPANVDEIILIAEPTFLEPTRPPKYAKWLTYYYIRSIKRRARRAINLEKKVRRRLTQEIDIDNAFHRGQTQRIDGKRRKLFNNSSGEAPQLAFDQEIDIEIEHDIQDWLAGTVTNGWLGGWLDEIVDDPIEREIMNAKLAGPWRTHSDIVKIVNTACGTNFKHDKVSKCLRRAEAKLEKKLAEIFGFRPTSARARNRATGFAPIDPVLPGECCDIPRGMMQAAAQYELDEDGYKIGPKILHGGIRVPRNSGPYSPAISA